MHSKLVSYVFQDAKIYAKTIDAHKTPIKGQMKWKAPDIVGVRFFDEYDNSLLTLCSRADIPIVSFYAYELKKTLSFSDYTQYFMQVISNSSWANESWLVIAEIDESPEFKKELERLNQSFGIGVLKLDMNDPVASEIIVPAHKKVNLDLETMNALCVNKNFKGFLDTINTLLQISVSEREVMLQRCINNKEFDKPEDPS